MGKTRVYSGCRDCKRCTNPAVANFGRTSGRIGAAASTLGGSEPARGFTRNCTVCGHKLSLHGYVYSPEMVRGVPTGSGDGVGIDDPSMGPGEWRAKNPSASKVSSRPRPG